MKKEKIDYIDSLRVLLMVLVVLHHSFITYCAPGGWYYIEATKKLGALKPVTLYVAVQRNAALDSHEISLTGHLTLLGSSFLFPS